MKRTRKEPRILLDFHMSSITGAEQVQFEQSEKTIENHWRVIYFKIIDCLVTNMEKRFSRESLNMAIGVNNFIKLNFDGSTFFIDQYKVSA